jgi:predicted adenylyl cyclase CyaB
VVKASIDDTTSSNGTARIEFEAELSTLSLDALDKLLLDAGCSYQAKWSRDRKEYQFKDIVVCIDRNAGYGYLAELEKIVHTDEEAEQVKSDLREMMEELGIEELPQDRLERMFAYYNEHWPEYYGTEKIFTIS